MVPSYTGASSYLIFAKYNNYAIGDGNGENKIALLDPNSTQVDPHPSANGLLEMREVLTVTGPTPDPQTFSGTYPNAKREWCINTAAVNPATKSIFAPNEDGRIHRWDLAANSLSQSVRLTLGIGEPYVPTIIGPDGTVFTLNGTALFALGSPGGTELVLTSSSPDLRNTVVGQTLTFTVTVTVGGSAASGTASFQDVFYPPQSLTATTNVLAQNVSLAAGQASYTSSALAAGSHFVTAIHDQSSANVTRVQQIHLNNSLTALSASSNPAAPGQSIVFTATVTASNGSVPTGMVTFQEGTAVLAQVPLDANGSARFSTSTLTVGNHTITGVYASDTLCAASSGSLTEVIQPSQPAGLRAIPGPNTKQVTLAWTANPPADGVALYEVWRATTEGSNYSQIGTSPGTSFVDTLQKSGQTRWYYIVARNASGNRSIPSVKVAGTAK